MTIVANGRDGEMTFSAWRKCRAAASRWIMSFSNAATLFATFARSRDTTSLPPNMVFDASAHVVVDMPRVRWQRRRHGCDNDDPSPQCEVVYHSRYLVVRNTATGCERLFAMRRDVTPDANILFLWHDGVSYVLCGAHEPALPRDYPLYVYSYMAIDAQSLMMLCPPSLHSYFFGPHSATEPYGDCFVRTEPMLFLVDVSETTHGAIFDAPPPPPPLFPVPLADAGDADTECTATPTPWTRVTFGDGVHTGVTVELPLDDTLSILVVRTDMSDLKGAGAATVCVHSAAASATGETATMLESLPGAEEIDEQQQQQQQHEECHVVVEPPSVITPVRSGRKGGRRVRRNIVSKDTHNRALTPSTGAFTITEPEFSVVVTTEFHNDNTLTVHDDDDDDDDVVVSVVGNEEDNNNVLNNDNNDNDNADNANDYDDSSSSSGSDNSIVEGTSSDACQSSVSNDVSNAKKPKKRSRRRKQRRAASTPTREDNVAVAVATVHRSLPPLVQSPTVCDTDSRWHNATSLLLRSCVCVHDRHIDECAKCRSGMTLCTRASLAFTCAIDTIRRARRDMKLNWRIEGNSETTAAASTVASDMEQTRERREAALAVVSRDLEQFGADVETCWTRWLAQCSDIAAASPSSTKSARSLIDALNASLTDALVKNRTMMALLLLMAPEDVSSEMRDLFKYFPSVRECFARFGIAVRGDGDNDKSSHRFANSMLHRREGVFSDQNRAAAARRVARDIVPALLHVCHERDNYSVFVLAYTVLACVWNGGIANLEQEAALHVLDAEDLAVSVQHGDAAATRLVESAEAAASAFWKSIKEPEQSLDADTLTWMSNFDAEYRDDSARRGDACEMLMRYTQHIDAMLFPASTFLRTLVIRRASLSVTASIPGALRFDRALSALGAVHVLSAVHHRAVHECRRSDSEAAATAGEACDEFSFDTMRARRCTSMFYRMRDTAALTATAAKSKNSAAAAEAVAASGVMAPSRMLTYTAERWNLALLDMVPEDNLVSTAMLRGKRDAFLLQIERTLAGVVPVALALVRDSIAKCFARTRHGVVPSAVISPLLSVTSIKDLDFNVEMAASAVQRWLDEHASSNSPHVVQQLEYTTEYMRCGGMFVDVFNARLGDAFRGTFGADATTSFRRFVDVLTLFPRPAHKAGDPLPADYGLHPQAVPIGAIVDMIVSHARPDDELAALSDTTILPPSCMYAAIGFFLEESSRRRRNLPPLDGDTVTSPTHRWSPSRASQAVLFLAIRDVRGQVDTDVNTFLRFIFRAPHIIGTAGRCSGDCGDDDDDDDDDDDNVVAIERDHSAGLPTKALERLVRVAIGMVRVYARVVGRHYGDVLQSPVRRTEEVMVALDALLGDTVSRHHIDAVITERRRRCRRRRCNEDAATLCDDDDDDDTNLAEDDGMFHFIDVCRLVSLDPMYVDACIDLSKRVNVALQLRGMGYALSRGCKPDRRGACMSAIEIERLAAATAEISIDVPGTDQWTGSVASRFITECIEDKEFVAQLWPQTLRATCVPFVLPRHANVFVPKHYATLARRSRSRATAKDDDDDDDDDDNDNDDKTESDVVGDGDDYDDDDDNDNDDDDDDDDERGRGVFGRSVRCVVAGDADPVQQAYMRVAYSEDAVFRSGLRAYDEDIKAWLHHCNDNAPRETLPEVAKRLLVRHVRLQAFSSSNAPCRTRVTGACMEWEPDFYLSSGSDKPSVLSRMTSLRLCRHAQHIEVFVSKVPAPSTPVASENERTRRERLRTLRQAAYTEGF